MDIFSHMPFSVPSFLVTEIPGSEIGGQRAQIFFIYYLIEGWKVKSLVFQTSFHLEKP